MSKVLFLSHRVPYPPNKGEKIRALHILEHLAKTHEVWLGAFQDEASEDALVPWLGRRFRGQCLPKLDPIEKGFAIAAAGIAGNSMSVAAFSNRQLRAWCSDVLKTEHPELVYIFSSAMAQYVIGRTASGTTLILDFVDVDSEKFRQYAQMQKGWRRALYQTEAARLLKFDRACAGETAASVFVSATERDLFASLCPECADRLHDIPNGVDCTYFDPSGETVGASAAPIIVFTGRMDYFPNVDAVTWFARSIFPIVRRTVSQARFQIVGAQPTKEVRALAKAPGIEVIGAVADVRPYYREAKVAVAPLKVARGIQNKILEAMAMARPVVVTPAALDGISALDGEHLLVGRDEQSLAEAVIAVLCGKAPSDLGRHAREHVLSHHDWEVILKRLDRLIENLVRPAQVVP